MSEAKSNEAGTQWNKPVLISSILILIFLLLPLIFTETAIPNPDTKVGEAVDMVKTASDFLSPKIWWYLLPIAAIILILSFYKVMKDSAAKPGQNEESSSTNTSKRLIFQGILTLEIYILLFWLPFPLHRYYNLRRVSMGWIADRSWVAAITLSIAIVALFLSYYSAYRLTLRENTRRLWMIVLMGAFIFALINIFVFPISSTDLFDYVSRGRMSGIYGGNPLVKVPNDYPFDSFVQLAAWKNDPSAYGPLWEIISGLIGRFVGPLLWNDMLVYKVIAFISYLLSTFAIAAILRNTAPKYSLPGTLFFAWNPLVILDGVANGHNDMMMIALILGTFWILKPNRLGKKNFHSSWRGLIIGIFAFLFLTLAILIKYIPVLLIPPFFLYILSSQRKSKIKLATILFPFLSMLLFTFLYYRVFWEWPEISNAILNRTGMFRTSLASVAVQIMGVIFQPDWAQGIAATFFLSAFGVGYVLILLRSALEFGYFPSIMKKLRNASNHKVGRMIQTIFATSTGDRKSDAWEVLVSTSLYIFLLYLLLGSMWFWPWYLIWPLAILALLQYKQLAMILIVVACAGQLTFILWNFVWYWMGIEWGTLHIIETLAFLLMIIPAIAIYILYHRKKAAE